MAIANGIRIDTEEEAIAEMNRVDGLSPDYFGSQEEKDAAVREAEVAFDVVAAERKHD